MFHPKPDYATDRLVTSAVVIAAMIVAVWLICRVKRWVWRVAAALVAFGIILAVPYLLIVYMGIARDMIPRSVTMYAFVAGMVLLAGGLVVVAFRIHSMGHGQLQAAVAQSRFMKLTPVQAWILAASLPIGAGLGIYWTITDSGFYRWFVEFQTRATGGTASPKTDEVTVLLSALGAMVLARILLIPWDRREKNG